MTVKVVVKSTESAADLDANSIKFVRRERAAIAVDTHLPKVFKGSRYAQRQTIGKKEIIERAPPGALRRFYRAFPVP